MTSIIDKELYQTQVIAVGGRDGEVTSSDALLHCKLSTPPEMGGKGHNTNPEQLFGAGYAACFLSAIRLVASNEKIVIPLDTTVTANVNLGLTQNDTYALSVQLNIDLPRMERSLAESLIEKAHAICPYSNAIRNNVVVNLAVV